MAPSLPHELWVVIFYFATYNTIRDMNYLVTPPPLAILYEKEDDELNDAALKIKHSLSLVCSLWRKLVTPFMLEDIKIRHGAEELAFALEHGNKTSLNHGLGHLVKRVQLSLIPEPGNKGIGTAWSNAVGGHTCRILQTCNNVVHLERRRILLSPVASRSTFLDTGSTQDIHDFERLHFPKLARVGWNGGDPRLLNNPSVDYVPTFILESPTVRLLSLRGMTWKMRENGVLMAVETLYGLSYDGLVYDIFYDRTLVSGDSSDERRELPSLSRAVMRHPYSFFLSPIRTNFDRVRVLEIDRHLEFLQPYLNRIVSGMPNVEELYYPLFFIRWCHTKRNDASPRLYPQHPKMTMIGMHAAHNEALQAGDITKWIIDEHITLLRKSTLPSLRKIRLCGREWASILSVEGLQDVRLALDKQVELTSDDPQTARALGVPL